MMAPPEAHMALMALMALMARGVSVDPRPNGTIGKPSLRNQKGVSIYLYFSRARASERGRAISAISAISAIRSERAALRLKNNQPDVNARAGSAAAVGNKIMPYIREARGEFLSGTLGIMRGTLRIISGTLRGSISDGFRPASFAAPRGKSSP